MKKSIYFSLAVALFLVVSAEQSFACSCTRTIEPVKKQVQRAYKDSAAIFSGEVVEISDSSEDTGNFLVKLKVAKSWKGELGDQVTISTAKNGAMCGYTFEAGKTYLVYADGPKESLIVTNCSRTTGTRIKGDVKYLARLKRQKRVS